MHIHKNRNCFHNHYNLLSEGYKKILNLYRLCTSVLIRVQVAFIKGVLQNFDIDIDKRHCIFLPKAPQKPDNQPYQQQHHFTWDTISPQILLKLMTDLLVRLVN